MTAIWHCYSTTDNPGHSGISAILWFSPFKVWHLCPSISRFTYCPLSLSLSASYAGIRVGFGRWGPELPSSNASRLTDSNNHYCELRYICSLYVKAMTTWPVLVLRFALATNILQYTGRCSVSLCSCVPNHIFKSVFPSKLYFAFIFAGEKHCGHKGMDMISNNNLTVVFTRCSVSISIA